MYCFVLLNILYPFGIFKTIFGDAYGSLLF